MYCLDQHFSRAKGKGLFLRIYLSVIYHRSQTYQVGRLNGLYGFYAGSLISTYQGGQDGHMGGAKSLGQLTSGSYQGWHTDLLVYYWRGDTKYCTTCSSAQGTKRCI